MSFLRGYVSEVQVPLAVQFIVLWWVRTQHEDNHGIRCIQSLRTVKRRAVKGKRSWQEVAFDKRGGGKTNRAQVSYAAPVSHGFTVTLLEDLERRGLNDYDPTTRRSLASCPAPP